MYRTFLWMYGTMAAGTMVGLAALSGIAAPPPVPHIVCPQIADPPVLDGALTEACWKQAAKVALVLNNGQGAPTDKTEALICRGEDGLYLGFTCHDSQMDKLRTNAKEPDDQQFSVYQDDCVEVFLGVAGRSTQMYGTIHDYYHFGCNAIGTQADGLGKGSGWDGYWEAKTARARNCWIAEVFIPFYTLINARNADKIQAVWFLNLNRHNPKTREFSSWSPTLADFHATERFGELHGMDVDVGRITRYSVTGLTFGKYNSEDAAASARIKVSNQSAAAQRLQLVVEAGPVALATNVEVTAQNSVNLTVPLRFSGVGKQPVVLSLCDPETKRVYYRSPTVKYEVPTLMSCRLDRSYYTREPTAVVLTEVNLPTNLLKSKILTIELRATNASQPVFRKTCPSVSKKSLLDMDITSLPVGDYRVRVGLVDQAKGPMDERDLSLCKLPPAEHEVKIDKIALAVLVDGKPFFPYGLLQGGDMEDMAQHHFNCYSRACTRQGGETVADAIKLFDQAQSNNLMLVDWWVKYAPGKYVSSGPPDVFETKLKGFAAAIPLIRSHPALLAYYTVDEPGYAEKDNLVRIYDTAKALDPYHPVFSLNCMRFTIPDGSDIAMFDNYMGGGYCGTEPETIIKPLDDSRKLAEKVYMPMWVTLASRMWSGPEPMTPAKQRCQTYLAIVYGAKGIFYFGKRPRYEPVWDEMAKMALEIRKLTPILLTPAVSPVVMIGPDKITESIHVLEKECEGKRYLIAVNARPDVCEVAFRSSQPITRVREFLEDRSLAVNDRSFTDTFPAYGAHVYEIGQ